MNILYHHRTTGRGAEGTHIASIVNAFEKMGHSVVVLSPPGVDPLRSIGQNPLDKTEKTAKGFDALWKTISKKSPQILFEFLEIMYNFSAILKFKKLIKKNQFDFIYERSAYFLFAGAYCSRKYNIPLVVEANEVVGIKRARKLLMRKIAGWIELYTFKRASSVFTVSSYLKDRILNVLNDADKVFITPNAVDPIQYQKETKRDQIRMKYELSGKTVLGFAGWFDWWDRLDILIDIQADLLKKEYSDSVSFIIGDGPIAEKLKEKVKHLGLEKQVIFTGPIDRKIVIDYIDALDIGVFAHSNEFGSPVVLFEMMALGKAIVAPALRPITDVLTDKVDALIFEPLQENQLKERIIKILEDPNLRISLGNKSKQKVFQKYTWENNAKEIINSLKIAGSI